MLIRWGEPQTVPVATRDGKVRLEGLGVRPYEFTVDDATGEVQREQSVISFRAYATTTTDTVRPGDRITFAGDIWVVQSKRLDSVIGDIEFVCERISR